MFGATKDGEVDMGVRGFTLVYTHLERGTRQSDKVSISQIKLGLKALNWLKLAGKS